MEVMDAVDGNAIVGVLGMALGGLSARFPEIQTDVIDPYLNEEGKRFVRETSEMCIPDAIAAWGARSTRNLTTTGESLSEVAQRVPAARDYLNSQKLGQRPLPAPMLVQSGINDDTVPYPQAHQMALDYCQQGENITFWTDPYPETVPGTVVNHAVTLFGGMPQSLKFLYDRFNDAPASGNCGQF